MTAEYTTLLKSALTAAFGQDYSLYGSYLDNLDFYAYAVLTVMWQDYGSGTDSILSFAEKIRRS